MLPATHIEDIERAINGPRTCTTDLPGEVPPPEVVATGFSRVASLRPYRPRSPWQRSQWAMRKDGKCLPILYILASLKYGSLDTLDPYWSDKDPSNVCSANVAVTERKSTSRKSKYGRSGTKEYWRKYWTDPRNRERRNRLARQRYHAKKLELGSKLEFDRLIDDLES